MKVLYQVFSSSRAAHSVLCGGRSQWVVLSAVAGDPAQSLHLPAEQSPKTRRELRTDWEGDREMCLWGISSWSHDYLLCSSELRQVVLTWDISLWNPMSLARERRFFFFWLHGAFTWWRRFHTNYFLIDFCVFQTGTNSRLPCITNGDGVIRPGNGKDF